MSLTRTCRAPNLLPRDGGWGLREVQLAGLLKLTFPRVPSFKGGELSIRNELRAPQVARLDQGAHLG